MALPASSDLLIEWITHCELRRLVAMIEIAWCTSRVLPAVAMEPAPLCTLRRSGQVCLGTCPGSVYATPLGHMLCIVTEGKRLTGSNSPHMESSELTQQTKLTMSVLEGFALGTGLCIGQKLPSKVP